MCKHSARKAAREADSSTKRLNADLEHNQHGLTLHTKRLSMEEQARGVPCLLRYCRFSAEDFEIMAAALASERLSQQYATDRLDKWTSAAEAPPASVRYELEHCYDTPSVPGAQELAPWASSIIRAREAFGDCCGVRVSTAEKCEFYLTLHMVQSPRLVLMLLPLQRIPRRLDAIALQEPLTLDAIDAASFRYEFVYAPGTSLRATDLLWARDACTVHVLHHMEFIEGHRVGAHSLCPLADWLVDAPIPSTVGDDRSGRAAASVAPPPPETPEWIKAILEATHATMPSADDAVADDSDEDTEEDPILTGLFARLSASSSPSHCPATSVSSDDFGVKYETRAIGADNVVGRALNRDAADWCKRYKLNPTISLSWERYDNFQASVVALGWCDRLQYLYNLFKAGGGGAYIYTTAEVSRYVEPHGFSDLATTAAASSPIATRIQQVRAVSDGLVV